MALATKVMTLATTVMTLAPGVMTLATTVMALEHIPVRLDRVAASGIPRRLASPLAVQPCTFRPNSRIHFCSSAESGPFSRAARFSSSSARVAGPVSATSTCGHESWKR